MEVKTIELREIKAAEGMVLTNGKAYSSVGGSVFLGINDSVDNWHEITEEEYSKIQKDMEAEQKTMQEESEV